MQKLLNLKPTRQVKVRLLRARLVNVLSASLVLQIRTGIDDMERRDVVEVTIVVRGKSYVVEASVRTGSAPS